VGRRGGVLAACEPQAPCESRGKLQRLAAGGNLRHILGVRGIAVMQKLAVPGYFSDNHGDRWRYGFVLLVQPRSRARPIAGLGTAAAESCRSALVAHACLSYRDK
jgi:hypothetical protein